MRETDRPKQGEYQMRFFHDRPPLRENAVPSVHPCLIYPVREFSEMIISWLIMILPFFSIYHI